jgi:hypothetical protein
VMQIIRDYYTRTIDRGITSRSVAAVEAEE